MRALIRINGFLQVAEIESAEIRAVDELFLSAPCGFDDIRLLNIPEALGESLIHTLFVDGRADLSKYSAEYVPEEIELSEEDISENMYECECSCGNKLAFGDDILSKGSTICPICSEELVFELESEEDGASSSLPSAPLRSTPEIEEKPRFGRLFSRNKSEHWD